MLAQEVKNCKIHHQKKKKKNGAQYQNLTD